MFAPAALRVNRSLAGKLGVVLLLAASLPAASCSDEGAASNRAAPAGPSPAPGAAAVVAPPREQPWPDLAPDGEAVAVSMPGTPTGSDDNFMSPLGPVTGRMYLLETADVAYLAGYHDYPGQARSPDAAFDGAVEGLLADMGGRIDAQEAISLDGHPGREVRFTARDAEGELAGRARMYLVSSRVYQILSVTADEAASSRDVNRFMDSLRFVAGPGEPATFGTIPAPPARSGPQFPQGLPNFPPAPGDLRVPQGFPAPPAPPNLPVPPSRSRPFGPPSRPDEPQADR